MVTLAGGYAIDRHKILNSRFALENRYSKTNEGAFHFDRISQVLIEEQKSPPVEDVTKLTNAEVHIDLENAYGSEGPTVDAEPGTLAAWGT